MRRKGGIKMEKEFNKNKRLLNEEIEAKLVHLSNMEHGTDEAKRAREDLIPLIDRSIELEKLELESEDREQRRRIEEEDKKRMYAAQCEHNNLDYQSRKWDRLWDLLKLLSAASVTIYFGKFVPDYEKRRGEVFDDDSSRCHMKNGLNFFSDYFKRRR